MRSCGHGHPGVITRRVVAWSMVLLLVACSDGLPRFPTPTAALNDSTPGQDYPPSTDAVVKFVQTLNDSDFPAMYDMLDAQSQETIQTPEKLRQAYIAAYNTATAGQVGYALKGGLLQKGTSAVTLLESTWHTILFSIITATSTLTMTYEKDAWRVAWTKDLIYPGMSQATFALQRDIPQRGNIFAADGQPLAAQGEVNTLGVRQSEINSAADEQGMLRALSKVTGLSVSEVHARYANQPAEWWIPIADISDDMLSEYTSLIEPYTAISVRRHLARTYPDSTLAPHVVGYVGAIPQASLAAYRKKGYAGNEQVGLAGVEGYMDDILGGSPGGSLQLITADGDVTIVASRAFTSGQDITLTISPTVQLNVQKILGPRRGAAVVMNPQTGAVLAMASYPTYDDAVLGQPASSAERQALLNDPTKPLLNRAVQGTYPAGSTFKMVTMAAGMGEGVTSPKDVFFDPGYWDGLGVQYRKTCWLRSGHGRLTLQDGLTASCDVVFYTVGKRLDDKGSSLLSQYGREFGFGAKTGIELTGESPGIMPDPDWKKSATGDVWTPGDTVNLAIGQGFMLATPLQVTAMTAAVASGGILYRPHVVDSIAGNAVSPARSISAETIRQLPVTAENLRSIQQGMVGVTTNARIGTTTFRFNNFDYYIVDGQVVPGKSLDSKQRATAVKFVVAGKSGTAQAPGAQDKPFAWFTAYAPADNPQIAVTVLLENAGEGSVVAAPLVRQIIESYFGLPLSTLPNDVKVTD